jgi:TonB family protein
MLLMLSGVAQAASVKLTIVSAKIDAAKIGKPGAARPTSHLSDLACLSLPGLRELPGSCGSGPAPATAYPIDALVRLEVGEQVIRTYPIPGTLTPKWEYSAIIDKAKLDTNDSANIVFYDYDAAGAEKKLGDKLVKARELLKPGTHTIAGVGPAAITLRVDAIADNAAPRKYAFKVPADQQIADLARTAKTSGPGYVVIPVAEGETVDVTATGKVQPNAKKHPDRVAGPAGIPTITAKIQFNQPGFRGCPGCDHAALIGHIGTTGFVVGPKKNFTVEHSGLLVLAINDLKVIDNAGAFDVQVSVSVPMTAVASKKKGSAADKPTAGMDPRVIQQIVDSHGAELDECALKEKDPSGDVVLNFTISADGTPLGVIVEKASSNLKAAGECMRQKALKWKFPPPRGVVSARYPMNFSPG